ncbi:VLRF1 family aeRF1-type release factor [Sporosarcina trichiuri]|uniref:VLRF1 family aeRF1-type release factor n=1 Tax=Sporosarcina trichiuri TaxID=3056445 RepID=UPI0025B3AB7E|nr:VLRF1 family aeRF1-type release factor [Sporosarcina sp. 0.2-SM1T-5]WJY28261.1 VLRF1 family aeRF1-type release factor [Sporosarcina sp. 0.2-SM1T-5]
MSLSEELQTLKDFHCENRCVLSVYLNTNPADPDQQKGAWKIQLKSGFKRLEEYLAAADDKAETEAFKKAKDRVVKEIEDNRNDLKKGVVIFASADPELFSVYYVQIPIETNFYWEDHPVIDELHNMLSAYPNSGIVMPSFGNVRFLDTAMGYVGDDFTYTFDSGLDVWREQKGLNPSGSRGTGGSHVDDLDDRLKENLERFYKSLAGDISKMKKERHWDEVHIIGEAEYAQAFAAAMQKKPDSIQHKNLNNSGADKVLHEVFGK